MQCRIYPVVNEIMESFQSIYTFMFQGIPFAAKHAKLAETTNIPLVLLWPYMHNAVSETCEDLMWRDPFLFHSTLSFVSTGGLFVL